MQRISRLSAFLRGVKMAMKSLSRASTAQRYEYAAASPMAQQAMRSDFYAGVKEAEADYQSRNHKGGL